MKLLLAEDEPAMSEAIVDILTFHRYQVDAVYDGIEALDYIHEGTYDGIILDIMMPGRTGLEVLSQIRREGNRTPVLLLTAKAEIEDRIQGLDAGADDYLPKPFAMGELIARVRAMLRRREAYQPDIRCFGDLTLNSGTSELCCGGKSVVLPKLEYQMMDRCGRRICMGLYFLSAQASCGSGIDGQDHSQAQHRIYTQRVIYDQDASEKIHHNSHDGGDSPSSRRCCGDQRYFCAADVSRDPMDRRVHDPR